MPLESPPVDVPVDAVQRIIWVKPN